MPSGAITASKHTKNQLEALINGDLNAVVDAAFAVKDYSLSQTINPGLVIEGLGPLGLPLTTREAPVVGSVGKSTGVGIFEIAGKTITFENDGWHEWLQENARKMMSGTLTAEESKPTFVLQKLVLQYAGSASTNFTGNAEVSTKLGELIVVLPSTFTGGRLCLSFGGKLRYIDAGGKSGSTTTLVATRSGVEHDLSSVNTGYRLSLVYHIIRDPGPIITPHAEQALTNKLRQLLFAWRERTSENPVAYLAILLDRSYSRSGPLSATSLAGVDAPLLQRLQPFAREIGFTLYLAQLKVWYMYEVDLDDMVELEGGETDKLIQVTRVVDLEGRTSELKDFDPCGFDESTYDPESDKFINGPLLDHSRDPDETETSSIPATMFNDKELYFENTWYRTAILLWPTAKRAATEQTSAESNKRVKWS
ncbi:hypothetical protein C8F01DRAFT_1373437 [Mycena amicta]|nr:hypothetical protein C8F01DRAFT_1373437 [Mycena amicta]